MYDDEPTNTAPEDDRIVLVRQIVEMEAAENELQAEADRIAKKSAALREQLRAARDELGTRMGWDRNMKAAKADLAAMYGDSR